MAANVQQQHILIEQLRHEMHVPRIQVSEACALIIRYINEHEQDDCLLTGFLGARVNPFREKSTCCVL